MMTYIAHFTAKHREVQIEQHSIFIWQQESGEVDKTLLANKIIRESSVHFFRLVTGENYAIEQEDISISVRKALPFSG
ncbi:MAG TPA: GTP-binding protein LepA [Pricia sp.]|nr:GTP-binding protein LepA [Pricia sp.]